MIIFSQWEEALDIVQHAMRQNHVTQYRAKGRSKVFQTAIAQWKDDARPSALLLPIKSGGEGLTLTEATHVMILDPLDNPARMAQAVNRVHRIGQTQATTVHVYVIKGTVEVAVNQLREERQKGGGGEQEGGGGRGAEGGGEAQAEGGDAGSRPRDVLTGLLGIDGKGTEDAPVELNGSTNELNGSTEGPSTDGV